MQVAMFVFQHGFGSIEIQVEDDLNNFLEELKMNNKTYKVQYFPTGKGMIVVVEYGDIV